MHFIVKLTDDYGANYYGPFRLVKTATAFVLRNLAEHKPHVDDHLRICIQWPLDREGHYTEHVVGKIIELNKNDYKPMSLKDGH